MQSVKQKTTTQFRTASICILLIFATLLDCKITKICYAWYRARLQQQIQQKMPGIVCWGDSLTAGAGGNGVSYPSALQAEIKAHYVFVPVVNMGVGGENTRTILARSDAGQMVVQNSIFIPSSCLPVVVSLVDAEGH